MPATFCDLHKIIQESFEWSGLHLQDFSFRNPFQLNKIQLIDGLSPTGDPDEHALVGDYREDQISLHEIFELRIKNLK